ncbi:DUF3365 domain-containing protein [Desulfocurvus sp.]|uniref:c-type heme family protein n=1 Tax=Desulfocurvus sp. TaxID=2871698 RepID=UPI0025C2056F|nr:DUF3365 domain-containing protein [Desulfocurvus sp.]MCK9238930.1 DUF3365 domain-containing protein [Desulfocurvus sp.]
MRVSRPRTIQTKFLMGLAAIALGAGLLFSCGLYVHLRGLLEAEVADKAEMVLDQVEAVRRYVRETLRPAMYQALPAHEFIIEAMSTSYVSRKVMEHTELSPSQLQYRRVAVGARNPRFEADNRELALIEHFRANPGEDRVSRFETIEGAEYYITAKPVRFTASCMNCHGDPADAPQVLLDRYGTGRGFGHELDSIAGLTSVVLPVNSALTRIRGATLGFVVLSCAGALLCFGVVNILFNRVVVFNLRRVLDVFPLYFKEQAQSPILSRLDDLGDMDEGDEIDEIMHAVEEMARTLSSARQELEHYAGNLRCMVDERTKDLSLEAMERRSDVLLFVSLLDALKTSQTRRELIETTLPSIGTRYGASRAAFICTLSSQNFFSWPEKDRRPDLPADWRQVLAEARPVFTHDTALIPVQPSDSALEGYLCLYWDAEAETEPGQMRDVLIALGRQMGIAMENLNALDTLLRHNTMLESIFEGIADPLMLMDGSCSVIMANEAARQLSIDTDADAEDNPLPRMLGLDPAAGERCPLRQVLQQGRPTSYEATLSGQRSFALNVYPLPGSRDRGGRVVVYARENTAEKRMLESIQQSEKLVTVGKLAAGLAHEINNPLGIILCYAELLRSAADSDQQRADVDVIIRHTKRAQRVMQDLLNFARPRGGGHGPCDPVSVIAVLADVFSLQAQKTGTALDIALPPDLPLVATSAEALEQIMGNLLLNALDAVSQDPAAPGRITVSASHDPEAGTVTITTADNGPGIAPEHLRRIFDPFFTTKEVGKGTGLGLAVTYGLVQQAGGTIEAANGGGAVFTLTLPVAPPAAGDVS